MTLPTRISSSGRPPPELSRRTGAALFLGFTSFLGSLVLAAQYVPDLRGGRLPEIRFLLKSFKKAASQAHYVLAEGEPQLNLLSSIRDAPGAARLLHEKAADWIVHKARRPFVIEVARRAYRQQTHEGRLLIHFSLSGEPWYLQWEPLNVIGFGLPFPEANPRELPSTERALLGEFERLAEVKDCGSFSGGNYCASLIKNSSPSQYLFVQTSGSLVRGIRGVGTREDAAAVKNELAEFLTRLGLDVLFLIFGACLVVLSLLRRQARRLCRRHSEARLT